MILAVAFWCWVTGVFLSLEGGVVCALAVRHEHSESTVMTRANRRVGICCGRHLGAIKCDRMEERNRLAAQFEQQRSHLRAVAYRMLGSVPESDDAVQETWLRLSQADCSAVENLRAWLTTVIARVSLNMLRAAVGFARLGLDRKPV